MSETTNKIALVTGANSGIGYELSKCFAEDGCHLVLVGRAEDELQDIATDFRAHYGVRVEVIARDLCDPAAAHELYRDIQAKGIKVNYLVTDSGQGVYGNFAETESEKELSIIHSNICALVVLTKHFLRDMLLRNQGRILQVASAVNNSPVPYSAVYAGTKAFVYGFTQAVMTELEGTNVTMTALRAVPEGELALPDRVARDGYESMLRGNPGGGFRARPSMKGPEVLEPAKRPA
jgi:short-subunit dehydrogenase